jgi:hypothetical protein
MNGNKLAVLCDGWLSFIANTFDACIQALNAEMQLELDENPQLNQNEIVKINEKMKNSWIL